MTEFDSVILPGGEGKVVASVNTRNFRGPVSKSVTVTTNDPDMPTVRLYVRANVRVAINIEPRDVVTLAGRPEELLPAEVTLVAAEGEAFAVLSAESSLDGLRVTVTPAPTAEATPPAAASSPTAPAAGSGAPLATGSSRYLVTITPTDEFPMGRGAGRITVTTDHPKMPDLPIRLTYWVRGPIETQPQTVFFRANPNVPDGGRVQTVRLTKAEGGPFAVESVEASEPHFAATVTAVEEGRSYDIAVRFTGELSSQALRGRLTVKTDDARQSEIVIPIAGRLRPPS